MAACHSAYSSCARRRLEGMTSSSTTRNPALAQWKAKARPAAPAPMRATERTRGALVVGRSTFLLGRNCGYNRLIAGVGVADVLGNTCPLFLREHGQHRQDAAQGYGNIVNVVHGTDSFTGKGHVNLLGF